MQSAAQRYAASKPSDINFVLTPYQFRCLIDAGNDKNISVFFKNIFFVEENSPNPATDKLLEIWYAAEQQEYERLLLNLNLSHLKDLSLNDLHFLVLAVTDYIFTRLK